MTQYIYFVKCPDFEDESFDFFDDAKNFARGCLSSKPVICQVEVNRNDFGECTNSTDLGQVWSWEDEMTDMPEDALVTFTKDDTFGTGSHAFDLDFDDVDISDSESILDSVPDNFRKPVPADMSITDLVEAMEENEDQVECKECFNLVSKSDCTKSDKGYVCATCAGETKPQCESAMTESFDEDEDFEDDENAVQCTWCEDTFDRSECRYEVDLGWLCSRCEMAIKSRGETLTFREGSYWDFLDEDADVKTECKEDYVLCPECGATAFDRLSESCVNCGFDTKEIMLEDVPLNFTKTDTPADTAEAEADTDGQGTDNKAAAPAATNAPADTNNKPADTNNAPTIDTGKIAAEINAAIAKEQQKFERKVVKKVQDSLDNASETFVSAVQNLGETTADRFTDIGRVLVKNEQKIFDVAKKTADDVEDIAFKLS